MHTFIEMIIHYPEQTKEQLKHNKLLDVKITNKPKEQLKHNKPLGEQKKEIENLNNFT